MRGQATSTSAGTQARGLQIVHTSLEAGAIETQLWRGRVTTTGGTTFMTDPVTDLQKGYSLNVFHE